MLTLFDRVLSDDNGFRSLSFYLGAPVIALLVIAPFLARTRFRAPYFIANTLRYALLAALLDVLLGAAAAEGLLVSALVEAAHKEGFRVVPLVGPSSIILALMASGLEGQRFAFCGYLPREGPQRARRIRELEQRSKRENETEIFIETPYRNDALLSSLLAACRPDTRLCVAAELTLPSETVSTRSIADWRRARFSVGKRPAVFLLLANSR